MFGIDYSYGGGLTVAQMRAAGVKFVFRYLSGNSLGSNSKNISVAEFRNLVRGGLLVGLVWEGSGTRALMGYAAGVYDAQHANAQADALGAHGIPLYFAADFDATTSQQSAINAYLDGVASVIGRSRTGLYGGYYPVKRAFDAGKISYGWQTYAWSGGQWDPRAQVQQYSNDHAMGPSRVDFDRSTHADFGQWPRLPAPAPAPKPVPPPAPKPAAYSRHTADGTLSLGAVALARKQSVADIVLASVTHMWAANTAKLVAYLIKPGSNAKMPKGLVYWTKP